MPNWESADYEVVDTKQNIEKLGVEIEKAMTMENQSDFDDWLGLLMLHIGWNYEQVRKGSDGCPNCRGWITDRWTSKYYPNAEMAEYHLATESAWTPMDECIVQFVRHFCPDAMISRTQMVEYTEEL